LHNVETLVRVAVAARTGSHRYRGTTLLTVVSDRRTVIEAQPTMSIGKALGTVPQAVLLGGYGGQWAPWNGVKDLPVDEMALRRAGFSLGAGVVAGLPSEACGLATTAALLDYLAASSARQCGPCIFGLRAVADTTMALARGRAGRSDLRRLQQQAGEVSGRGACHHPDGGVRLLRSALTTFADDVQAHVKRHRCLHSGEPAPLPIPEVGAP
jgi:NADH:ubiquinone oxidoreductase subunit F (NADH-binding)